MIDGETGTERTRQPVPDDFVADGPSGGHFGIAYLDGEHPSLVTKSVTRVGARRGAFRVLFQTWDFNGTDLTRRWKYVAPSGSGATSFHQIRTVDVDQDGRDEIADGTYVVNSDGILSPTPAGTSRSAPPGAISGSVTSVCGGCINAPDPRPIPRLVNT